MTILLLMYLKTLLKSSYFLQCNYEMGMICTLTFLSHFSAWYGLSILYLRNLIGDKVEGPLMDGFNRNFNDASLKTLHAWIGWNQNPTLNLYRVLPNLHDINFHFIILSKRLVTQNLEWPKPNIVNVYIKQ